MAEPLQNSPWLATADGGRILLHGNCSFGRSPENTVRIVSEKVSRRHAAIHGQDGSEFWLVDLGSVNGTLLNGTRLSLPTRLRDGDRFSIAGQEFTFRAPDLLETDQADLARESMATMPEVLTEKCWLLVADIEGFTQLSQRVDPAALSVTVGKWVRAGREVIEKNGGAINKYLGDGYLAYWRHHGQESEEQVAAAAREFRLLQAGADPKFRIALHYGTVSLGGAATQGEECLMGPDVSLTFRLEKLAGSLKLPFCLSAPAQERLNWLLPARLVEGEHSLKGFGGSFRVYQIR
jgi:adenylate cyclase